MTGKIVEKTIYKTESASYFIKFTWSKPDHVRHSVKSHDSGQIVRDSSRVVNDFVDLYFAIDFTSRDNFRLRIMKCESNAQSLFYRFYTTRDEIWNELFWRELCHGFHDSWQLVTSRGMRKYWTCMNVLTLAKLQEQSKPPETFVCITFLIRRWMNEMRRKRFSGEVTSSRLHTYVLAKGFSTNCALWIITTHQLRPAL